MITVTINSRPKQIPTTWEDIPWKDYCEMLEKGYLKDPVWVAAYLLGYDEGFPDGFDIDAIVFLSELLEFTRHPEEMLMVPYKSDASIANEPWSKFIAAQQALQASEGKITCGGKLVKIYTGEDIDQQPVTEALPKADFFLPFWLLTWRISRIWQTMRKTSPHKMRSMIKKAGTSMRTFLTSTVLPWI